MNSRYDLERREQERRRLLEGYRSYVDQNSPPLMSDLKKHMRPLLEFGYANLPELLNIVNAKIFPMRVVDTDNGPLSYSTSTDVLGGLRLIDTRDNEKTLRNLAKSDLPTHLRNVKSFKGRKYIVKEGVKHWIPDSETKNALGLEANSFVQPPDKELDKLKDGVNIQSVKSPSTRLVRTKKHHNDVFIVFTWPETHRRHVPDEETLAAMHRRQGQVKIISEAEMQSIPEKEAINRFSRWDRNITKSNSQTSTQTVYNINGPVANAGLNKGKIKQKNTWKFDTEHPILTLLGAVGAIASIVAL